MGPARSVMQETSSPPTPVETLGIGARLLAYAGGTPHRTFVLYPLAIVAGRMLATRGHPNFAWPYLALFAWGYLQYRLCGTYRRSQGAGGRGMKILPTKLMTTGPYAITRNPMYLGHLIAMLGIALFSRSRLALALPVGSALWFDSRVRRDEDRLTALFGDPYRDYLSMVPRWL